MAVAPQASELSFGTELRLVEDEPDLKEKAITLGEIAVLPSLELLQTGQALRRDAASEAGDLAAIALADQLFGVPKVSNFTDKAESLFSPQQAARVSRRLGKTQPGPDVRSRSGF